MKKLILLSICVLLGHIFTYAQPRLYQETDMGVLGSLSRREEDILRMFRDNPDVAEVIPVKIDFTALKETALTLEYRGSQTVASQRLLELHENSAEGFSWFGSLTDETGVFFTVMGRQVASKFYLGNVPMLLQPFRDDYHLLVAYHNSVDAGICGHEKLEKGRAAAPPIPAPANRIQAESDCVMRVLWVVTAQAEPEITMALELAARMLQDETNLAYQNSQITYRMEMARVLRTTYTETTSYTSASAYGTTYSFPSDLINLSTGAGLLSGVPTTRNLYNADIVVMVRTQATSNAQGIYGVAYGVPEDPSALNSGNAFALISTQYMIGGRFTFAHEMGHIQGARHDSHSGSPVYARGYIFSTSASNNRTIMAVGGACNPPTGCRVQFFSNPYVTYGGIAVGVAGQYENYRRINETAPQVLGFRTTSANLLLPNETFQDEILARHLATATISTNNSTIVAQSGSRVSMRAGESVTLLPGFQADYGSLFHGYIGTCSSPAITRLVQEPGAAAPASAWTMTASPNPSSGRVQLQFSGDAATPMTFPVEITDMMGRKVIQMTVRGHAGELDLSGQPAGAYILRAHMPDGHIRTLKLIRE